LQRHARLEHPLPGLPPDIVEFVGTLLPCVPVDGHPPLLAGDGVPVDRHLPRPAAVRPLVDRPLPPTPLLPHDPSLMQDKGRPAPPSGGPAPPLPPLPGQPQPPGPAVTSVCLRWAGTSSRPSASTPRRSVTPPSARFKVRWVCEPYRAG